MLRARSLCWLSSAVVVSCSAFVWTAFARGVSGAGPEDAAATRASATSSKIHPGVLQRFAETAPGTQRKLWVFFADKGIASEPQRRAALERLMREYSPRAIHRRQLRRTDPGMFDERDFPIATAYLQAVRDAGAVVHVESTWLNAVSVLATREQTEQIATLPCVRSIQPVLGGRRRGEAVSDDSAPSSSPPATRSSDSDTPSRGVPRGQPFEGIAYTQEDQIGVITMHSLGHTGNGIIIGILDTGFKRTHDAFNFPGHPLHVIAEHDFIFSDDNTANEPGDDPGQHNHGTYVLGLIGAYLPNQYVGGAYDASFILCKTEDIRSETPIEEDNYVAGLQYIEAHGGDIATASLGYIDWYTQANLDGMTAVTTIGVNIATSNGLICCNAAGNEGNDGDPASSSLIAPADAHRVITCGAVDASGAIAGFSSSGPTADGRIKPEILARGVDNFIVRAGEDTEFTSGSGTSFATPMIAGTVACLLQSHPAWTVDQMRMYLFTSTAEYAMSHDYDHLFVRGFGIANAAQADNQDCNLDGIGDSIQIASGTLADCNGNDIPDGCEVMLGPLAFFATDANADGVPDECPTCPADWNHSGVVNSQDYFDFLNAFFAENADFNHNGATNSQDYFDFLAAFFTPC